MKTKRQLEIEYCCPVYSQWRAVPAHLHTRKWYHNAYEKTIPKTAKPDAVKGGGGFSNTIFFLFDERKWLSEAQLKQLNLERKPVI